MFLDDCKENYDSRLLYLCSYAGTLLRERSLQCPMLLKKYLNL